VRGGVLWRKLRRDLWQRKGGLLALLGIIAIGVGTYVAMASVWRDLDGARDAYYRGYRLADFTVDLKRAPAREIRALDDLPNVRAVRGRVSQSVLIELPNVPEPIPGTALSMPARRTPVLDDVLLRTGTWFSGRDEREVILTDAFAAAHGLKPGDRIKVLLADRQHDLLVVGTAMSPEFVYLIPPDGGIAPDPARFGAMYLSEDFLRKAADLQGAYNQVLGDVHRRDPTALANTLALIADRLDPYGVTQTAAAIDQPSARYLHDELAGLRVQARMLPGIFLGVAALVLNLLLGRMVAQQRTIIGTLRALGYSSGRLTAHYLGYGVVVGLVGGLAGVILGWWLQGAIVDMYQGFFALPDLRPHLYGDILATGVGISLLFSALGTLQGVRGAVRLLPADAMRPPPPERGVRVLPERIPPLWRALSFRWKMVLRTVFRNPFRSAVSVLASVVATALVFAALSMDDALRYLMDYEFAKISHEDVSVALRVPKEPQAVTEIGALPGISFAQSQLAVACDLRHGPLAKRVAITALPRASPLCTPLDDAGRPIVPPDSGLLLSDKLAQILDARPGDTLRLRPLIGRRTEVDALVAGTVETFLGLTAYADVDYLSRLLGEERVVDNVLATTFSRDASPPLLRALEQRPAVIGVSERARAFAQLNKTFGGTMGAMIGILVLFAGLIAFGSVLNAALVSLSERQREVGTLRVLGYSATQVAGIFAAESMLLNLLGTVLGLYAGIGLAHAISAAYSTELYRFPAVIRPSSLALSATLMVLFLVLAQLVVLRLVKRLDWLAVLNVRE